MPGIVFLSGGQTPVEATAHLNAMAGEIPGALYREHGKSGHLTNSRGDRRGNSLGYSRKIRPLRPRVRETIVVVRFAPG